MATSRDALTKIDLEELLQTKLDAEGSQIDEISVSCLTKPGENYGSTLLTVDVTLKPGGRLLHLVAKMLPKFQEYQKMFDCEVTVRKEIDFYILVHPAYDKIQRESSVSSEIFLDISPVCYGARISREGDTAPVDESSVILLENLRFQGYGCGDRFSGLDLEHCRLVVEKLARFHAISVAMKVKKPEEFQETVLRASAKAATYFSKVFMKPLEKIPEYEALKERINIALKKGSEVYNSKTPKLPREPFAALIHGDLWTNNIMFRYESGLSERSLMDLKFIDFQFTCFDSPARDLLFFLYSSAELKLLSDHYDYLIKSYYNNFIDYLKVLGCDIKPFSFGEFLKEIELSSVVEFWHTAFMLIPVNQVLEDSFNPDSLTPEDLYALLFNIGNTYIHRASKLITDYASRNWI